VKRITFITRVFFRGPGIMVNLRKAESSFTRSSEKNLRGLEKGPNPYKENRLEENKTLSKSYLYE